MDRFRIITIYELLAILALIATRSGFRSIRRMLWRYNDRCHWCGYPVHDPTSTCSECGHSHFLDRRRFFGKNVLIVTASLGVICGCVVAAVQLNRLYNYVPDPIIIEWSPDVPTRNVTRPEEPVDYELLQRVWAGTISPEDLGKVWAQYFDKAVEYGHSAVASADGGNGWTLWLDIPSQIQRSPSMVVEASLLTSDGVELVSKEIWTINQWGESLGLTLEDIAEDMRIACSLEELPDDKQVVLTLGIRPWSDPQAESQIVCRYTFPVTIVP